MRQNESLVQSLEHLRTTQRQLVQREKLASLGALTAGIAHEIQNTLNFVDSFAEVGLELVQELREGLNHLTDEYLRLAYHGLRAKHPDFNATITTDFSLRLGIVPVVVEDLGRVLLNLFNNAFYAIH